MNLNLAQVSTFKRSKMISKGITSKTYLQSNDSSKKLFKRPRFFDESERELIIAKYEEFLADTLSPLATTFDECTKINFKEKKLRIVVMRAGGVKTTLLCLRIFCKNCIKNCCLDEINNSLNICCFKSKYSSQNIRKHQEGFKPGFEENTF